MKLKIILILIFLLCGISTVNTNPIVVYYINEIYIGVGDWQIELSENNYNGWYLKTKSDSSYFKDNLSIIENLVITNDSLSSDLYIDPTGDYIILYDEFGNFAEAIYFDLSSDAQISAPGRRYSICRFQKRSSYNFALDSSPALGQNNDIQNSIGTIEGIICDSLGNPLNNVVIEYDYIDDIYMSYSEYTQTNDSGYFQINYYGVLANLKIEKYDYEIENRQVQIWPDSLTKIDTIKLRGKLTDVEEKIEKENSFLLFNNYPNPFNPTTKIQFTIPAGDAWNASATLKIYDILGNEIATLLDEQKQPGTYEVEFDGAGLPSGIYFYKLLVGNYSETKKMLLMK